MVRAQAIATDLGLTFRVDQASDPFFGRVGQMKAVSQVQQSLKFELLIPLRSDEQPTACMSFNYHRDHFGTTWGINDADGEPAHTGCVAFGMDRLAVAMFHTHGIDIAEVAGSRAGDARPHAKQTRSETAVTRSTNFDAVRFPRGRSRCGRRPPDARLRRPVARLLDAGIAPSGGPRRFRTAIRASATCSTMTARRSACCC